MDELFNLARFFHGLYHKAFIDSRSFVILCSILLALSLPILYLIEPFKDFLILTKPEAYDAYLERLVNLLPLLPLLIFLTIWGWRNYLGKLFLS